MCANKLHFDGERGGNAHGAWVKVAQQATVGKITVWRERGGK